MSNLINDFPECHLSTQTKKQHLCMKSILLVFEQWKLPTTNSNAQVAWCRVRKVGTCSRMNILGNLEWQQLLTHDPVHIDWIMFQVISLLQSESRTSLWLLLWSPSTCLWDPFGPSSCQPSSMAGKGTLQCRWSVSLAWQWRCQYPQQHHSNKIQAYKQYASSDN
jgi:hypothetical protein